VSSTIIDNGGAGYSETGTWATITTGGFRVGANARYSQAGTGAQTASWQFTGLTPSTTYWLGLTWAANAAWPNAMPLKVYDSNGTTVLLDTTIDETIEPADFTDTAVLWFFLGAFVPTGTSLTITVTDGDAGYTIADAALLADTLPDITQVSVAPGNVQTGANWNIGVTPDFTKKIVLKHAMTMTADQPVGDGTDNLFIDASDNSASLTITGCVLTLKGHAQWGNASYNSGVRTWLTVENTGATPGGVKFDGNSGVTPHMLFGRQAQLVITGQSKANPSYVETKSGSAGENGYLGQYAASAGYLCVVGSGVRLTRLGKNGVVGLKANYEDVFQLHGYTIDACGIIQITLTDSGAGTLSLQDGTYTNPADSFCLAVDTSNSAKTSGTREILRHVFLGHPQFHSARDVLLKHIVFDQYFEGNDDAAVWDFQFNFVRKSDGQETLMSGGATSSFWLNDGTVAPNCCHVSRVDSTYHGNLFQKTADASTTDFCIALTEGGSQNRTITATNNVVLKSSAGGSSGPLSAAFNNGSGSFNPTLIATHNTVWVPPGGPAIGVFALSGQRVDEMTSCKSNLFVRAGGSVTGTFAIKQDNSGIYSAALTDSVSASACDYNGLFGMDTVPAGTWTGTSGDTGVEDGTAYDSPMSGASVPGSHDVIGSNPQFVNGDVGLEDWAVAQGSVAGTDSGKRDDAFSYLQADPTLIETSLIPFFEAALKVQNIAYMDAGHDGVTIGAMAYQSSIGPSYYERNEGMAGGMLQLSGGFQSA
jgi:hypothetical protein